MPPGRAPASRPGDASREFPGRVVYSVVISAAIVIGLALRLGLIAVAPQNSYLPDHKDALAWGTYAYRHGPWTLYDMPTPQPIFVRIQQGDRITLQTAPHGYNYPPLSAYVFWFQAWLWHQVDSSYVILPVEAEVRTRLAEQGVDPQYHWLPAWTYAAQFASAVLTLPVDILLAFGVLHLVRVVSAPHRRRLAELAAFCLTLLAPPVFLDSAYWNQYEAWVCCPAVWAMVFVLRDRWGWSGLLFGAACMLKTSALLFVPVIAFACLTRMLAGHLGWQRSVRGAALFTVGAALAVFVAAAPFVVRDVQHSKPNALTRWFRQSYVETAASDLYPRTTLAAFNLWWLDYAAQLAANERSAAAAADALVEWWGLTKDAWGKSLMLAALVMALAIVTRRGLRTEAALVFACLVLLAAFALPTRVHERYIYFCIPQLIAMACLRPFWFIPCGLTLIVGTFEMTSYSWVWGPKLREPGGALLTRSVVLACLTLVALLSAYGLAIWSRMRPPDTSTEAVQVPRSELTR